MVRMPQCTADVIACAIPNYRLICHCTLQRLAVGIVAAPYGPSKVENASFDGHNQLTCAVTACAGSRGHVRRDTCRNYCVGWLFCARSELHDVRQVNDKSDPLQQSHRPFTSRAPAAMPRVAPAHCERTTGLVRMNGAAKPASQFAVRCRARARCAAPAWRWPSSRRT